jgi:hypothetical protein
MAEHSSQAAATDVPTRRPYHGSCHCGHTKYIAYITLPPPIISATPPSPSSTVRIRKCNCSTCHKMSIFHLRLMDSPEDFQLLSPLDPATELRDYMCFKKIAHWYFCGTCGVRCFGFVGQSELKEVEVDGQKRTVWAPKKEGWVEDENSYLTINSQTLEPGQEGLNMQEWTEKGWIAYLDCWNFKGEPRLGKPHEHGIY